MAWLVFGGVVLVAGIVLRVTTGYVEMNAVIVAGVINIGYAAGWIAHESNRRQD